MYYENDPHDCYVKIFKIQSQRKDSKILIFDPPAAGFHLNFKQLKVNFKVRHNVALVTGLLTSWFIALEKVYVC